ncbi:FecR domain-containing protein [Terrimonas sp. NA20]|uniref:FecR domain-containing protein n=1 Tax=Terrimonas ginsenosidimutans TaxID=2908004 RepID=A0ABS9KSQ6_9BACT|nr:FecR family protein [Terrimonas ginsenosidimutans]MCG2615328.1 FecR domain-containing protein [Terrimonas ginsenosidimutans]
MEEQRLQELIDRYISDRCSPEEMQLLAALISEGDERLLSGIMDRQLELNTATAEDFPGVTEKITAAIAAKISAAKQKPSPVVPIIQVRRWKRLAVAAVILAVVSTGVYFWQIRSGKTDQPIAFQPNSPAIIEPGKDGAILTLADGRTMVLDSLGNGILTTQSGSKVVLENGQLSYNNNGNPSTEIAFNTISTPKGRQFRLQLEDGTRVWLNAASSLKYPASFTGSDRRVEITGEAYFEVAKDQKRPFHVKLNDQTEIEVLGTQFNVNAYANEGSINTTLLEGSVQINNRNGKTRIVPGQQAQVFAGADIVKVLNEVNTSKITAWKDGVFNFENASLFEVMRQLERWYDIEVEYDKGVQNYEFFGKMGRDLSLQEVLRGLEMNEVNFKVEGRRIVVR